MQEGDDMGRIRSAGLGRLDERIGPRRTRTEGSRTGVFLTHCHGLRDAVPVRDRGCRGSGGRGAYLEQLVLVFFVQGQVTVGAVHPVECVAHTGATGGRVVFPNARSHQIGVKRVYEFVSGVFEMVAPHAFRGFLYFRLH